MLHGLRAPGFADAVPPWNHGTEIGGGRAGSCGVDRPDEQHSPG